MTNHDAPATHHNALPTPRFVPVSEAVRILGLSATTIRRRIDAGELEAERVVRPQGTAFLVKLPADASVRTEDELPRATEAPATPTDAPETHQDAPPGANGVAAVLVPLVAQLAAAHETIRAQAETIGGLTAQLTNREHELGRQGAELEHARAARDAAESSRRREHRRLTVALAVVATLAIVGALAPAWLR
jgi:serine/threonine protein kinase HipA of HipAB toxin-antitoxin module